MNKNDFVKKRESLVKEMLESGALRNSEIKKAFQNVSRELFFPKEFSRLAYDDNAFPIGFGQTISQPSTIAIMLEMLEASKGMKVLEIGSGSGYVIALLSKIVGSKGKVFGIEIVQELKKIAEQNLAESKTKNFELFFGNGCQGLQKEEPFDRIIISAACPKIPFALAGQLKEGGKIVAPIGGAFSQELVLLKKEKGILVEKESRCCFVFVPLKC